MNIHLAIRTQAELGVRYDPPPPGRLHEGAVSLTADGIFAIFSSPDQADELGRELLEKAQAWRHDLGEDTETGRHTHCEIVAGTTTTLVDLPVYVDPVEDTEPVYPDPAALQALAATAIEETV